MHIAQVAPLYEAVPPKLYGGTERVVAYLTEELLQLGHEVTLFASGESCTKARLVPAIERSLRLGPAGTDECSPHLLMLEHVTQQASRFDVIHFHVDYLHFPFARRCGVPHLTTLHGRLDLPHLQPLFSEFRELPMVSISDAQRAPLPQARWLGTVYHGLPLQLQAFQPTGGDYFAFIGRIAPEKRVDRAIVIAKRLRVPLKIAAKVCHTDRAYFEREIAPLIDDPLIDFVGEIGEHEKAAFLGGARALLFTIDWPEPFGLAMIEAMACGTPVVAFECGSVPEIVEPGVTGFIVRDLEAAVEAAARIGELDRRRCRQAVERRFGAARMAADYLDLYANLLGQPGGREPLASCAAE